MDKEVVEVLDSSDDDEVEVVGTSRVEKSSLITPVESGRAPIFLEQEPRYGPLNDSIIDLLHVELSNIAAKQESPVPSLVRGCRVSFYEQRTPFSCTYSSLMMLVSALLSIESPCYRSVLFQGFSGVPDVRSIQRLLEGAWQAGFDVESKAFFGGSIENKPVRIGPSDVCALLRANKVPVRVFDFDYGADSFATVRHLIWTLFRGEEDIASSSSSSVVFPLILGDAKHTVLVVGVTPDALIVFDPALRCQRAADALKGHDLKPFLLRTWKARQFQLLAVGPEASEHPEWLLHSASPVKYGGKVLLATRPPRVVAEETARQVHGSGKS